MQESGRYALRERCFALFLGTFMQVQPSSPATDPLLVRAGRMGKDYLILRAAEAVLVTVLRPK